MDGSFIVLDCTGSDSSASVICLDSPLTRVPAMNLCSELKGTGADATLFRPDGSLIVISDSSEDEEDDLAGDKTIVNLEDARAVDCQSGVSNLSHTPEIAPQDPRKGQELKNSDKQSAGSASSDGQKVTSSLLLKESSVKEAAKEKADIDCTSLKRRSKRLISVSTPAEALRKKQKLTYNINLASTPLPGSTASPDTPAVTPIAVKYERIRSELSATKKQQQKLVSVQEGLLEEVQKFRNEFASKKKEDCQLINVKQTDDSLLRPIVIDGSNVAMSHGNHKVFSCKGIALCVQYFQKRGHHNISVMVPLHRKTTEARRACRMTDQHILDDLESKGLLSFTPSRQLKGRRVTPYDDRFILKLACMNGGVIVSNDNYRDLMVESDEFRRVVENRLIMYVFAGDNFMVPEDPHGRDGPRLSDILRKDSEWSRMETRTYGNFGPVGNGPNPQSMDSGLRIGNGPIPQLRRSPRIARLFHGRLGRF